MNRARQGYTLVVAMLGAVLALPASAFPADQIDVTTGRPMVRPTAGTEVRTTGARPAPQKPAGSKDVLWDLTHVPYAGWYHPLAGGNYTSWAALLTGNGFTVSTTTAGLDTLSLSPYQILVVNVLSAHDSAYTASEVTAISAFVNAGGGLLLVGDNPGVWPGNVNPVAAAFGVTVGVGASTDTNLTSLDPHPVTAGVTSIFVPFAAGGTLSVGAPSVTIGRDGAGQSMLAVAQVGTGKVVSFGDGNACDNNNIGTADNPVFCLNVFNWLTTPTPVELQRLTLE